VEVTPSRGLAEAIRRRLVEFVDFCVDYTLERVNQGEKAEVLPEDDDEAACSNRCVFDSNSRRRFIS